MLALSGIMPSNLSFVAFEDDICVAYTKKNLLRGGSVELACEMIEWKPGAGDLTTEPGLDLLRKAVLSLSVTFFGSQHRQKKITRRGYQQYGEVLRQLNSHLSQPHLQTTDETILTVLTCMLLEIFLPTGPNNFLKHVRGIEAILDLRGPPVSATETTSTIFHGLRVLSIIGGLAQSRPSIYAREEWKSIPPLFTGEATLIRHEIFQILADCTLLMSAREKVAVDSGSPEAYQALLANAHIALEKLKALFPRWERYNERKMDETTSGIGKELRIANHASATTYMLYNAAYMCILRIIHSLDPSPKHASLRNSAAIKIVRCLELRQFKKREGGAESNTIGFVATKVAWEALGGFSSPEGRRLARVVKSAANGIFAIGAWENWDQDRPRLSPVVGLGIADQMMWNAWNQPIWAEHQPAGVQMGPHLLVQRDIINLGEKQTTQQAPPYIHFEGAVPHRHRKADSFLSIQDQLQSSEIIDQLKSVVGSA